MDSDSFVTASAIFGVVVLFRNVLESSLLVTVLAALTSFFAIRYTLALRARQAYPPGPSGWPIIGNALQIPQVRPWLTYSEWAKTYGDLVHLDAFGEHLVVINSIEVAKDLLDKRSTIYSDRPRFVMACELSGYGEEMVLLSYGDDWRAQRKLVVQSFTQSLVPRYYSIQEHEARRLVQGVMRDPSTLVMQTKGVLMGHRRIAAIIMRVTYGYEVEGEKDKMINTSFEAMDNFSQATEPGAFMVDLIPALKYLPEWMPGTSFLQIAKKWKQLEWDASWVPYLWLKKNLKTGNVHLPNLCATVIESGGGELSKEDEAALVWGASSGLGGGLDTNMSTIFTFCSAMLRYPHIQAKAQAEIDAVVGPDRLPSIKDRASLPYVRSLITEVFRWQPAIPLCLPHALRQDDIYKGMLLPKGCVIIPNVWYMLHDPAEFPDPMEFRPERFGGDDAEMQKVTDLAFGFGRRFCPGYHFAEGTAFAVIATLLATCTIVPKLDAQGKEIIPELTYTSGTIVFPEHTECDIKPRSEHTKAMLAEAVANREF
ncbi:uncharacterized protein FIBRA_07468 [Fibroporia radiculosa]|uniref:Cytochrome P450 n=1 Tax=Fibroporia radiculosa TaxID=599839 RepID=J4GEJ1_9APHY|nr:uncharacterized protein FIBRA_07468 [Fibroporia radiculosa]CCM05258.1 predicted protein [Fibroporia radiculosa]